MMSIDPIALVAPDVQDDAPIVLPLAVVDQSIQDSWQASSTSNLTVSQNTGEKPQSKVWTHGGDWFAAMPNSSGSWIWRLDNGNWTQLLKLSNSKSTHADVKAIGNVAHILLFDDSSTQLASVQYVAVTRSYEFWSARPGNVNISLPSSTETASIDIDSLGRMWLAYDNKSAKTVEVRYSDGNYATWSGPITVATGIASDDIAGVVAMGNGQIGVMWSNQNTKRFGFRTHDDGADPNQWNAFEVPAEQSAKNTGSGMADDHLNLAAASDGTVYAAVKTSYDSSGSPDIALLVRRPNGGWDPLYEVSSSGTRPIVVLNEALGRVIVAYTKKNGGGDILYNESSTVSINFGPARVLIGGNDNNVTSTKQSITGELLVLASSSSKARGTLLVGPVGGPTLPVNQPPQVNAGPDRSTPLGTPVALQGSASDDGQPDGSLTLQWTMVSGPGLAFFGNDNQAATNVTFSTVGTYVLRLTATDGSLTSSDDVLVQVTASASTNQPPNVNAGADFTATAGVAVTLNGSATDDGLPSGVLLAQWSLVSGPGNVNFGNVNSAQTTATFSAAGTYVLRLTASDGSLSSSDEVTVVVSAPSAAGLTGFWNFMPGIGADYPSLIGHLGSVQGGAAISSDGRLTLSGASQRYEVANAPELQISQTITIATWIKPSTQGTQYVVKKAGAGTTNGFELSLASSGTVFVRFNEASSGNSFRVDSKTKYPTNGNTWMHIAATYDGSTIRLYINGVEEGSMSASFTIGTNNLPLSIGSGNGGYRAMRGQLDEVLLTDRALSASEISQVHKGGFQPAPPAPVVNQPPSVNAGPDRSAVAGTAITLSGSASDDGQPANTLSTNWSLVSGPGSVSFGNASSTSTTATFSAAGTYVLRLTAFDGQLSASDEAMVTVSLAPIVNQPPTVNAGADRTTTLGTSITITGSASDDGQPANTLSTSWSLVSGPGTVSFGNASAMTTNATFSAAGTYVLRLTASDGALSASDDLVVTVTPLPITSSGVVGRWSFDTTDDSSAEANHGSLQGGATLGAGQSGGGLQLNGSNQRMIVPDSPRLDVSQAITIAAWIQPSTSGTQYIVKKAEQNSVDGFELSLSSAGRVFVRFNQASSGDSFRVDSTSKYPTNGGTWMHVVATYDGTTIRLFVNGVEQGSKAASFTIGVNDLALAIGAEPSGFRSMRGAIDDVLLANRALTSAEIQALYAGTYL